MMNNSALDSLTDKQRITLVAGSSSKAVVYRVLKEHGELTMEEVITITGLPYTNVRQALNELTNNFSIAERIPSKYRLK